MASPVVSASLNKSTYAPSDAMSLVVNYSDPDNKSGTVTVTVTDASGASSAPVTLPYTIVDALTIKVTDAGRTWTKQSDSGSQAVYTAVA